MANGKIKKEMTCYEIVFTVKNILAVVAYRGKYLNLVVAVYCFVVISSLDAIFNIHDINH